MASRRPAPRQQQIVEFVRKNPGCSMADAARATRRRDSEGLGYGYHAIHRCIELNLVEKRAGVDARTYSLHLVPQDDDE